MRTCLVLGKVLFDVRAADRAPHRTELAVRGRDDRRLELRQELTLAHLARRDLGRAVFDDEVGRASSGGDRGGRGIGFDFGRAVGGTDGDLALRRVDTGRALLHDVGELVRHQPEVARALAAGQEHIGAVRERARAHCSGGFAAERIAVHAHVAEVGAEMATDA